MKSLITVPSALALSFALASIAAAQPQTSSQAARPGASDPFAAQAVAQASTSQAAPLPVAEAKKRYHATQEHLQRLLKGRPLESLEVEVTRHENDTEIAFHQPRDRVRAAVTEAFDARRLLQQAELAELESRVARIKRAMEIRDAMRETLIDQRTDELVDQMEEAGKTGNRDAADADRSPDPDATGRATVPPDDSTAKIMRRATPKEATRILKHQLDKAKANLESAERTYERAVRLFQSGAISKELLAEEELKQRNAKLIRDRLLLQLEVFRDEHPSDLPQANKPAGDGAGDDQPVAERLTQLDLKEEVALAEANLAAAKNLYDYSKKMHTKGYVTQGDVESKTSQMERARFQLERAKMKLDAFLKEHPELPAVKEPAAGDGAAGEPTKKADQPASAGAPVDDGASVDDHAMLAALESNVEKAKAERESAEREYKRFEQMRVRGTIEPAIVDEQAEICKRAQIRLEREELERDAFLQAHRIEATDKPPADRDAQASNINRQIAALNVQEAEANLAEQEIRYEHYQRHVAANAIQPQLLDEQAEIYKQAQLALERAKAKLKALSQPQAGDRAADEQTRTSSEQPAIESKSDSAGR